LGELYAYYRIADAGIVTLVDSTNEHSMRGLEESGLWNLPRLDTPFIAVLFSPSERGANPLGRLCGVEFPNALSVLLPLSVQLTSIDRVLDLRRPEAADWFAYYFSRLVVDIGETAKAGASEEYRWVQCCPYRPKLDAIREMLPTLLTQEPGGGLFCQMAGSWLRQNQVNALIYPSVRSDPRVEIRDGEVIDSSSWNLVDYRGAGAPYFRFFFDFSDYWEEKVRVGLGLGVGELPKRDPYHMARVEYVTEGPRRGSWRAVGIMAVKMAIMQVQQNAYLRDAGTNQARDLHWVDELPVELDVKQWIKLFVSHDYKECVRRGMDLLPKIESFEMLQMFLLSLQRSGEEPAGGGWTAAEVFGHIGFEALMHHQHDPELHKLLAITLGVTDPGEALDVEQDRTARCRIHYYAAARLISAGRHREALQHLNACIDDPGSCLEAHLAMAHRDYDYNAGVPRRGTQADG
jgi:hypothetical protein